MNNGEHERLTEKYKQLIDRMSIIFYRDILAPMMLLGRTIIRLNNINSWFNDKLLVISEVMYGLPIDNILYISISCRVGSRLIMAHSYGGHVKIIVYIYDDDNIYKDMLIYITKQARLVKRTKVFSTNGEYLHGSDVKPGEYLEELETYVIPLLKTISETIESELIKLQNNEER